MTSLKQEERELIWALPPPTPQFSPREKGVWRHRTWCDDVIATSGWNLVNSMY